MKKVVFVLVFCSCFLTATAEIVVEKQKDGFVIKEEKTLGFLQPLPEGLYLPDSIIVAFFDGTITEYEFEGTPQTKFIRFFPPMEETVTPARKICLVNGEWQPETLPAKESQKSSFLLGILFMLIYMGILTVSMIVGHRSKRTLFWFMVYSYPFP